MTRNRKHIRALLAIVLILITFSASAQRRITPVDPTPGTVGTPEKKTDGNTKANVAERYDANGNVILVDTITGVEWVDSTAMVKVKKMEYPLLHSIDVGVNIWDPMMRLFGQHYGLIDFWAELSLHNRYKPIIEFGFGNCNDTPDGMNFTYKSKLAPYFKIGANYNIFYNSNPDYQFNVGLRYGYSSFSYEITDVTIDEGYWNAPSLISIPSQNASAGYFEITAGVKVKIIGPISLGWNLRYHSILHESQTEYGKPMYIPGYGKRGGSFTGSFSVIYTIPLHRKNADPLPDEVDGESTESDTPPKK